MFKNNEKFEVWENKHASDEFDYFYDFFYGFFDEKHLFVPNISRLDRIRMDIEVFENNEIIGKYLKTILKQSQMDENVVILEEEDLNIAVNLYRNYAVMCYINSWVEALNKEFLAVQYFQPIRSRGDRYYRVEGISNKTVDSDGSNAPMILYMMSDYEKINFREWCKEYLGFYYSLENIGDGTESTSIFVNMNGESHGHNLTDVGFGYSQIFPIVLSIWQNCVYNANVSRQLVLIEQPELHLHPQAHVEIQI